MGIKKHRSIKTHRVPGGAGSGSKVIPIKRTS